MPQFTPGSLHTATVKFANQASVPFTYDVSFCLGASQTEVARKSFSVPGGQSLDVVFSITMPSTAGSYPVYLKVSSGGKLIATFTSEALGVEAGLTFGTPTGILKAPTGIGYGWRLAEISCVVTNPSSVTVTRQIKVLYGGGGGWYSDRTWVFQNTPSAPYTNIASVWKEVTLGPGQSTTLKQPHEFIIPGVDPYLYGSYWNGPGFGIPSSWSFKLVDDLGNESPVITLTRNA